MKLEASLKHFSPQGMHISDDVKGTSPDRITGTDVMAAIGTTSSRARFGLAAFFGKTGISKSDEQLAVQALARHAMESAPRNVRKAAAGEFGWCMLTLAQFAFAEYSRSAETSVTCHDRKATSERGAPVFKTCERCSGNGFSGVPSTAAYKAILKRVPDLHVRTWTRNWKPFLEGLVDVCYREEQKADSAFQEATSFRDDVNKI